MLTANTLVTNPETGETVALLAGEEPPAWAAPLIGAHLLNTAEASLPGSGAPVTPANGGTLTTTLTEGEKTELADQLGSIATPWLIVEGDLYLGEKGRFVTHRDKAAEFTTAENAQTRLEEIAERHSEAHIEAAGEISAD